MIWVWNLVAGTQPIRFIGHTDKIYSVAFSPDGKSIASGSADNTVRLWDTATGEVLKIFKGHTAWVWHVAFSPDGETIASGSWDTTIRLWNSTTGAHLKTIRGHTHDVLSVAFSPDGKIIASAGGKTDKTIRLWDATNGALLKTLTGHTSLVECVVFSPDGLTLASASDDTTVGLWALTKPKQNLVSLSTNPFQPTRIGEQLTFSLNLSGEKRAIAYQATVEYDATVLRYIGSTVGNLPDETVVVKPVVSENRVKLAAYTLARTYLANCKLAAITFEVIAVKPIVVKLSDVLLTDSVGRSFRPRIEEDR